MLEQPKDISNQTQKKW